MALIIADRILETSTTTGTGALTLAGAKTGFRTFASVCSVSDMCFYAIQAEDVSGIATGQWEAGLGTYSSANTLTRTTVYASSTGTAVSFSAGTKAVWLDVTAAQTTMMWDMANNSLPFQGGTLTGSLNFSGVGARITGDFSNATGALKTSFQSNVVNGTTLPYIIPNGTGTTAGIVATNSSDPTNCSFGAFLTNGATDVRIQSGAFGTGTNLPLAFITSGLERLRVGENGALATAVSEAGLYTGRGVLTDIYGYGGIKFFDEKNGNLEIYSQRASATYGNIKFTTTATHLERLQIEYGGIVRPGGNNTQSLGSASYRWSTVYAGTGTINTSDAREKTRVRPLTLSEIAAAKQLASEIGAFQFLSAVADKGDLAREHIGMTVQRAIEIMESHGLDPFNYGFICYDAWEKQTLEHPDSYEQIQMPETETEPARTGNGALIKAAWTETLLEAGDRYSFRSDELLLFVARGFEARLAALEARP